jgi:hypothetical protein
MKKNTKDGTSLDFHEGFRQTEGCDPFGLYLHGPYVDAKQYIHSLKCRFLHIKIYLTLSTAPILP